MKTEEWRAIPGFEGYSVSNLGRVRSDARAVACTRNGHAIIRRYSERLLTPCRHPDGYWQVGIFQRPRFVHRLVALAFIPNPTDRPQVNHLDGDKGNNAVGNLAWVTVAENHAHAYATGLRDNCGESHINHKLTGAIVLAIREDRSKGLTYKALAEKYGICKATAREIAKRIRWKHV